MTKEELELAKLELEKQRFELEKQKIKNESKFTNKHFGLLVTAFLSIITFVVSYSQIQVAKYSNQKNWELEVSKMLLEHKSSMVSDENIIETIYVRNVIIATIPEEVTSKIFRGLAEVAIDHKFKKIWEEGDEFASATIIARDIPTNINPNLDKELSNLDKIFTVEVVSEMFIKTSRVKKNIEVNLPYLLDALKKQNLIDKQIVIYALSVLKAESAGFEPIFEFKSKWNTSPGGHPFDLYDNRTDLGNIGKPDGEKFKGRGFVQLTGRNSYKVYSEKLELGDQLIQNPDLANNPKIAAEIFALMIKEKEAKIRKALSNNSFIEARRLLNGGSYGSDAFVAAYKTGLENIQ